MAEPMTINDIAAAVEREILGSPIDPIPVELRAFHDALHAEKNKPLSCDLTGDRTACSILRQWARRPWEPIHRGVLLDRMDELGKTSEETLWARGEIGRLAWWQHMRQAATRTRFHRILLDWRTQLIHHFGDFESQTDTP